MTERARAGDKARPRTAARLVLGILVGPGLALLLACGGRQRPNVLLIVLDTARADRFTFDGYARDTSPRLAALAAEGAVYERAYTPAPWTLPAHASLFTGLFPSSHGADSGHLRLDDEHVTLAEAFLAAGYHTVAYVANPWVGKGYHFDQGFETYDEVWRPLGDQGEDAGAAVINDKVSRWLEWRRTDPAARARPFFMFINYLEAHLPYRAPDPEGSRFLPTSADRTTVERLRQFRHPEDMRFNMGLVYLSPADLDLLSDLYDGEITYLDRRVGELTHLLRRRDLMDRTVMVVTSDHGESLGEHHLVDHKLSVYDNLLRIPLVVRYPPAIRPGQRIAKVVMLQDLYPTLLDLAQISSPVRPSSHPAEAMVLPGITSPAGEAAPIGRGPDPIVAEFARPVQFLEVMHEVLKGADTTSWDRTLVAWRVGDEKLQWASDGKHRLFDLTRDPGEERDLAAERPDEVAGLARQVEAWLARPGSRPPVAASSAASRTAPRAASR